MTKPIKPHEPKPPKPPHVWTCVICGSVGLTVEHCPIDGQVKP